MNYLRGNLLKNYFLFYALLIGVKKASGNWFKLQGDDVGNQHSEYSAPDLPLPGSRAASANWFDKTGKLWMFGGIGFSNDSSDVPQYLNDFWYYNVHTKKWNSLNHKQYPGDSINETRKSPVPRKGAAACGVEGVLFVLFGGELYGSHKLNDTWIFDIKSKTWIPLYKATTNPVNPSARSHSSSWCLKDRLIVFGGAGNNNQVLNDMWEFSLKTLNWELLHQHADMSGSLKLRTSFPLARIGSSTWIYDHSLYMFGGSTESITKELYKQKSQWLLSDLWKYDLINQTWLMVHSSGNSSNNTPKNRMFAGSWVEDSYLYIFGGYGILAQGSVNTGFILDYWRYSTSTSAWKAYTIDNIPDGKDNDNINKLKDIIGLKDVAPTPRCSVAMWKHKHFLYLFGGHGFDRTSHTAYLNDLFVSASKSDIKDLLTSGKESAIHRMMSELSPTVIFIICIGSFGGVVCIFGAMFFLKKMIDYPNHAPTKNSYNVKYSPLNDEIIMDT